MTHIKKGVFMKSHIKIQTMMFTAILIAVGTVIPMFMPKVEIGPMSFTLASHVATMIAIFISPMVALIVALGTTLGFLLAGFPFIVVLRALSHIIFAYLGACYIKKHPDTFQSVSKSIIFNIAIACLHAIGEMVIVIPFYYGQGDLQAFLYMIFGLVGIGTLVHSSVDFVISLIVWKALVQNSNVQKIAYVKSVLES